ncbi:hypothetical protein [Acinetobacter pittii]|uniref:hypothetical protein n=1 Tax=Acinetobacter pittii TaxID=48296 RepID=UPI002A08BD6B|nr:hypothetical protein [Acinetobacter pittii]MDX8253720.1 hypothetical protein [Acinetobacter pittii]
MQNIIFDSFINKYGARLYTPDGLGPFPSVIIVKQFEEKKDEPSLEFYATKMNEIGFLAFTFICIAEKQIETLHTHISLAIDYLTTKSEVDKKKIFLLIADRDNIQDININVFDDRIQALASLSWLA